MKKSFFLFIGLIFISILNANAQFPFTYISPIPGSKFHSQQTTILLRADKSSANINPGFCTLKGNISGEIRFSVSLSKDKKILIIKPEKPFAPAEKITVNIQRGFAGKTVTMSKDSSFEFFISPWDEKLSTQKLKEYYATDETYKNAFTTSANSLSKQSSYKGITIDINNQPEPGYIFIRNSGAGKPNNRYTSVLNNNATSIFSLQDSSRGYCFQLQQNGYFSYFNLNHNFWEILDSGFKVIDTVSCANGYKADLHDFIITPENHYLLMAYDPQTFDMTTIVQNGNPNATVIGFIIQELDENKNLVFQWRSWDYFNIKDALHLDLKLKSIDYVHGNSFELDNDGNIIFSSRHLDEVTKINRNTGKFIWRMGGVNNQFRFIGDSTGFCYQHDARRLANGNFTVFDNGNFHLPQISAAKEYVLDEDSMTATLVWNFTHPGKIYSRAMGNAQRLPGGNTWINWGLVNPGKPAITEVRPDGTIAWQATFNDSDNAYRSYKYQWQPKVSAINEIHNNSYQQLKLFPNPVLDDFTVSGNFSGRIYFADITGKVLYADNNYVSGKKINTGFLKTGIYFIKLQNPDNTESYIKLIKN